MRTILSTEQRIEQCISTVHVLREDAEQLLGLDLNERQARVVKWAYDQRIRGVNMEISALRKKIGLPTAKDK